ncbi:TPA: transmembrane protein 56-like [Bos taurus]|nr:TPA: transmembrane protein 56-like [Bos taurus]
MDTNTILLISTCFASFFTFQIIFHVVSYWFSAKISPGFNNLNFKKKIEWNSRVVSTCHSLVVGLVGLYIFLFDEAGIADPLWGDTSLGKVNVAIASGYLVSDLLILIWYWKVIGDKYFVIHHCTALYAYHFVLNDGVLVYVGNFRLLAELSSPFVNQRPLGIDSMALAWILIQFSWISTCVVLDVMNVMWMIKISKGCIKVISLLRQEKARKSLQNGKLD